MTDSLQPIDEMPLDEMPLDELCINTIRTLAIDAVERAQSGHPGTPMALAPAAYVLWTRLMRYNPRDPEWFDRDRFVLSNGHASMLLYALVHLTGFDLSMEELRNFRQWGSKTPGHPEHGHVPGVEATTGPLGQGLMNAVGMAMAEAHLAAVFNRTDHAIVDHCTYVFCSDGDLMEGASHGVDDGDLAAIAIRQSAWRLPEGRIRRTTRRILGHDFSHVHDLVSCNCSSSSPATAVHHRRSES